MGKSSFKSFIEQKKAPGSLNRSVDWEGRKNFYLIQLEALFKTIGNYLRDFIESKDVILETTFEEIEEENVGKYEIPVLHIRLCGMHAALVPAGTNMIGTPGRVDLVGNLESKRIILADKDESHPQATTAFSFSWLNEDNKKEELRTQEMHSDRQYVWKIITDPPKIRYIDLNEDNFLSTLQEILDA
jgi:hypothetical protein